jgi:eukaryotic-like serine/threonine-protein kinase
VTQPTKIGRYEVIERVGRGGMGAVYLGRDSVLEREVAIKVMSADFAADETSRPRFYREARAAAKLQHRNIVTIFEFGEEDETPFIVMEFLRGQDLAKRMRAEPPLTLEQKIDIIAELCTGLHFAHEQGVIHRDVKPANIWLVPDGSVKLLDFGIAKFSSSTMTRQGSVLGSISYMPPEQINGLEVDGRADVFSAGVVLFELLTGKKPFAGDSPTAVLARIMDDEPVRVQDLPADLPKPLVAAVLKALQKDREKRYRHAADFGADLRLVRSAVVASTVSISTDLDQLETMVSDPSRAGTIDSGSHHLAGSVSVQRTATLAEPPEMAPAPRRFGWFVPVVAVAVLAGAVGGWLLLHPPPPPKKSLVTITSEPAGARVAVDGVETNRVTPTDVEVPSGAASLPSVTLTSPAHKPVTAQLTEDDVKKGNVLLRMEAVPPAKPQPQVQAQAQPAQPPPEVVCRVAMTGEYPFEVLDGSRVLSGSSTSHSFTVKGKPRLKVRNPDYFLDQPVQIDGAKTFEWAAPGLGKLFMTAPPLCTVAIAGRNLGESPIQETMAAGTYAAEVTCDGQVRRQTFSIAAGETSKVAVKK